MFLDVRARAQPTRTLSLAERQRSDQRSAPKILKKTPGILALHFGVSALLHPDRERDETATVSSDTAKVLVLNREHIQLLLGPIEELLRHQTKGARQSMACRLGTRLLDSAGGADRIRVDPRDLEHVGLLGVGGFGTVSLWEHKTTKEVFAKKAINKGHIVQTDSQESVLREKQILLMLDSRFIVKLYETYQDKANLYFLLEVAIGGDLCGVYRERKLHGSEAHAVYYTASVILAFEHLHARYVVYRDLKPENVLLNEDGRVKVTDMGLAKFVVGKTFTVCGTPDFMAPELIDVTGYSHAVDWWTLGVMIFELMAGHAPFEASSPVQIFKNVKAGIDKMKFPAQCQGSVADLVRQLLRAEPEERLTSRPGGTLNLRQHAWYSKLNWKALLAGTLAPPYKPAVTNAKDLQHFNAKKEFAPPKRQYVDDGTGWDTNFATWTELEETMAGETRLNKADKFAAKRAKKKAAGGSK